MRTGQAALTPRAKILITINWAERLGGAEEALWSFLRHVDRDRLEAVVVFHGAGTFEREVAGLGLRTIVIPASRLRQVHRFAASVLRLRGIIRREDPALVVNWLTKAHLYGGAAALIAGGRARSVWLQHDFPSGPADALATALPTVAIVCCSEAVAQEQRRLRLSRRVLAVHPGSGSSRAQHATAPAGLRRSLGIGSDRLVLGIVGRLIPWKRQHAFLEALAMLRADGHDVHGLVVGGDAHALAPGYEQELGRRVIELGLDHAVTFTGQVADAGRYMGVLDVLVSASSREPFGMVLVEAMAAGVPVVAVDAAGPREIVEDGRSGILAASGTAGDLAHAVSRLLEDPALRRAVASGGRARYAEFFTPERRALALEALLVELAERSPPGQPAVRPRGLRRDVRG